MEVGKVITFEYMNGLGEYGVWKVEVVKSAADFIVGKVITCPNVISPPQQWGTFRFARMGQVWN